MNLKTSQSKICSNCKEEFVIDSSDFVLYEKVGLNIPKNCFECRLKKYFAFWPFGKFRKGVSDLSGESLITVLPLNPRYPIYKSNEWYSDAWNSMDYGIEYDPDKSFFEQLKNLQERVPRPHQISKKNTNCDYCDDVWESKNCYLARSIFQCEDLSYSYRVLGSKNSFDIVLSYNLDNCYDCVSCYNSFNLNFSENCKDCIDSYFLFDCRNTQNCFMSYNLRNKQYCIRNKQYNKEDYEKELQKIRLDSFKNIENLKKEFEQILQNNAVH